VYLLYTSRPVCMEVHYVLSYVRTEGRLSTHKSPNPGVATNLSLSPSSYVLAGAGTFGRRAGSASLKPMLVPQLFFWSK